MKSDIILKIIASLLIPLLMLSGFLIINDLKVFGFFAFITSLVYFSLAYLLYYIKYGKVKTGKLIIFKVLNFGIVITFTGFLFYIMLKLTNFL